MDINSLKEDIKEEKIDVYIYDSNYFYRFVLRFA